MKKRYWLIALGVILMGLGGWFYDPRPQFENPPGGPTRDFTRVTLAKFLLRRILESGSPVSVPTGHVIPESKAFETLLADQENPRNDTLTWVGHATFLMRLNGLHIITDPFMTKTAGVLGMGPKRYVPPGIALKHLPPLDVIVVSHNHYEHLDMPTIRTLPNKAKVHVVVPKELGVYFKRAGYKQIHELNWGEVWSGTIRGVPITVRSLPAYHFSRRKLNDYNKTLWAGYGITTPSHHVYFSGDTTYGKVFKRIGKQYGPFDLGLISIGAYEPRVIMKSSHVTPEEAVQLGQDLDTKVMVGMHWGTIVLTDEPPFEAPKRFRAAGKAAGLDKSRLWLMKIGETRMLSQ